MGFARRSFGSAEGRTLAGLGYPLAAAMLLSLGAGHAVAQARFATAEVSLTLVAEPPAGDGRFRAALAVDLAPGWKTYWLDPGDAGIAPRLDFSKSANVAAVESRFPAPHRFGDETGLSNGYSAPFAIALTVAPTRPGEAAQLRTSVTLGVCKDICIPVSANLALDRPPADAASSAIVAAAFAGLPRIGDSASGAVSAELSPDRQSLTVKVAMAGSSASEGAPPNLFLAGPDGWTFGTPAQTGTEGAVARFTVPVLDRPRKAGAAPLVIDAVVSHGDSAVETMALTVSGRSE